MYLSTLTFVGRRQLYLCVIIREEYPEAGSSDSDGGNDVFQYDGLDVGERYGKAYALRVS